MLSRFFRIFLILIFLVVSLTDLSSQRRYFFTEQWNLGLGIGATSFYGDLTDKTNRLLVNSPFSKYFYQDRQAMAVMTLEKKINIYFGVRGHLSYGRIKSTQENTKQYFVANLFEYSLSGTIDFTNIFFGHDRYRKWTFYGHAGIGFTESRSWKYNMMTGKLVGTNGFGSPKREGGKYIPMTETVFPFGIGGRFQLNKYFSIWAEMALHPIKTDKLDATVDKKIGVEAYGIMMVGVAYHFALPDHFQIGNRHPSYTGRSSDPALKSYNKKRRVVMQTKGYKKGLKNRKKFKTTKRKRLKVRRR